MVKPGTVTTGVCCGPANEKIAADLAELLALPIPPVTLHEWPIERMTQTLEPGAKAPSERFVGISNRGNRASSALSIRDADG